MKITAWSVKTPKGLIRPEWMFDNKDEADEFASRLNESMRPHNWQSQKVEIKTIDT